MDLYISMSSMEIPYVPQFKNMPVIRKDWSLKTSSEKTHTKAHVCPQLLRTHIQEAPANPIFLLLVNMPHRVFRALLVRGPCSIVYNFYRCDFSSTTYLKAHFPLFLHFFESTSFTRKKKKNASELTRGTGQRRLC